MSGRRRARAERHPDTHTPPFPTRALPFGVRMLLCVCLARGCDGAFCVARVGSCPVSLGLWAGLRVSGGEREGRETGSDGSKKTRAWPDYCESLDLPCASGSVRRVGVVSFKRPANSIQRRSLSPDPAFCSDSHHHVYIPPTQTETHTLPRNCIIPGSIRPIHHSRRSSHVFPTPGDPLSQRTRDPRPEAQRPRPERPHGNPAPAPLSACAQSSRSSSSGRRPGP